MTTHSIAPEDAHMGTAEIAVTPEILEALVMACGVLDSFRNGEATQEELDDLSRRMDDVIAKAAGITP